VLRQQAGISFYLPRIQYSNLAIQGFRAVAGGSWLLIFYPIKLT
jgi:hypothetical protein